HAVGRAILPAGGSGRFQVRDLIAAEHITMRLTILIVACAVLAGCKSKKAEHQESPGDTLHHNVPINPDSFGKPSTTNQ
ncbi:MAG TPA: hypothetical protein VM100_07150, partial [Longimicrobiales bacterium]|nr:hypothetical protein [Longimicrobiales bacterium]